MAIKKGKREVIDTATDKRFAKREQDGTFKESVGVGRSLAADRRSKSKTIAKPGYGDQGDQSKGERKSPPQRKSRLPEKNNHCLYEDGLQGRPTPFRQKSYGLNAEV